MSDDREESAAADERPVILVVEDEVLIRMATADFLRDEGYDVLEGANGEEALIVIGTDQPIHLLLSDIRMPGAIDGVRLAALARILRPRLPIVLMSSHPAQGADEHADYFLAKPFPESRLLGLVKKLIGPQWKTQTGSKNAS